MEWNLKGVEHKTKTLWVFVHLCSMVYNPREPINADGAQKYMNSP